MCLGRIPQWHPATDRQNELDIAHVIGKLAHLGWIRLRKDTRNLHCRILRRSGFRQYSSVATGAILLYRRDQLRRNVTNNSDIPLLRSRNKKRSVTTMAFVG